MEGGAVMQLGTAAVQSVNHCVGTHEPKRRQWQAAETPVPWQVRKHPCLHLVSLARETRLAAAATSAVVATAVRLPAFSGPPPRRVRQVQARAGAPAGSAGAADATAVAVVVAVVAPAAGVGHVMWQLCAACQPLRLRQQAGSFLGPLRAPGLALRPRVEAART